LRAGASFRRIRSFVDDMESEEFKKILYANENSDKAIELPDGTRLRVSCRTSMNGKYPEIFFRVLPTEIPNVAAALSAELRPAMSLIPGIFVVSGATGAGKTTLLASLAAHFMSAVSAHVVTIEDPVEYILSATNRGYASQREVGTDTESFASGVRGALREDPDVIIIGEIRDEETAKTALTAAETGHMVFATVHASSCFGAIERYLALVDSDQYNSMRLCHAYIGGAHVEKKISGTGCFREYEIFFNNDAARTHIREKKTHQLGQSRNLIIKKTI